MILNLNNLFIYNMKRLPDKFIEVLDKINKINNYMPTMSYKDVFKCYKKIDNLLCEEKYNIPDINNVINYYKLNNEHVKKLKNLIDRKNTELYNMCLKSKYFSKLVTSLKNEFGTYYTKEIDRQHINEILIKILKQYKNTWNGYWTIISLDSNGNIINMNMFDQNDKKKVMNFLNKKYIRK